jgi:hypothetical protein
MKGMEFLFVVAEVSVVYVGFATLIVVVVQQFSGARAEIEVIRLQSMMLLSLLAVAFSLFPYLLFSLDVSARTVWRISSFALGSLWLAYNLHRILWIHSGHHKDAVQFMRRTNRLNLYVTQPFCIACLFSGALGLWGELVGFVYLSAILVLLLLAAYVFMGLVNSMSAKRTD